MAKYAPMSSDLGGVPVSGRRWSGVDGVAERLLVDMRDAFNIPLIRLSRHRRWERRRPVGN